MKLDIESEDDSNVTGGQFLRRNNFGAMTQSESDFILRYKQTPNNT